MKYFVFLLFIPLAIYYFFKTEEFEKDLVVYSYSSFVSPWGPGPVIQDLYYQKTGRRVQFVDAGDGRSLLKKLEIEKYKNVDIILGLDQYTLQEVSPKHLLDLSFEDIEKHELPLSYDKGKAIPYDWAPLGFSYRGELKNKPRSLKEFFSSLKGKVVLMDPRTSTPGLHWLSWIGSYDFNIVNSVITNSKQFLVMPSWTTSYALFKKGEVDFVFTYQTSRLYHLIEENVKDYHFLIFEEGHPVQIEYVAVLANSSYPERAKNFIHFLLTKEVQSIIMKKNYMLPVVKGVVENTEFETLKKIEKLHVSEKQTIRELLNQWNRLIN